MTNSRHDLPVAPNLLEQRFEPTAPNQQWLVDSMKTSLSRKGNCYDYALMESFRGSLKNELTHHQHYETRAHAKAAIQEYIEVFYNRQRRH